MAVDDAVDGRPNELSERYSAPDGRVFMTGVQAVVRLVLDQRRSDIAAGLQTAGFVTGYPGSPVAGLDLELERRKAMLHDLGVVHRPALNEELAATAVAGSQLAALQADHRYQGVSALWYGKAPGLDRAGDAIRHGNLMGTGRGGGVLVVVGDDPQAKSSSVPSTSEPSLFSLGLPVLSPADPQEILDLGLHGFAMSRVSGLWVGMRIPASVADASQTVAVGPARVGPIVPDLTVDGEAFAHQVTAQLLGATLIELERSLYGPRLDLARRYASANGLNRMVRRGESDVIGVVAAGPAYLAVVDALRRIGLDESSASDPGVRVLKVGMPYPLDQAVVREFARGLAEIVVVEDKRGFLEALVKDALYGVPGAPAVVGKIDDDGRTLIPATGEVEPDVVAGAIAARVLRHGEAAVVREWTGSTGTKLPGGLPLVRGAYFCSGCPHNSGVRVPAGVSVGSGSGCHGLAIQMDPHLVGTVVGRFQMGGEGAMWNGMEPFVESQHFVQNLGDGTFAHSGSLALRSAVASGVNITFKLLVNSTVAMTGGQPVAGGRDLRDLIRLLRAEGVGRVILTTDDRRNPRYRRLPAGTEIWDRSRILEAEQVLAATPGVTVLIHDQQCAAEKRRQRGRERPQAPERRVFVNPLLCDGCGDCGIRSNCLSVRPVDGDWGRKAEIHQESCNADYTCLDGDCPALMTVSPRTTRPPTLPDFGHIPRPDVTSAGRSAAIRITGIGGTGVITVAQVLAVAAHLDGLSVRGLDQTGIAQKGGSVVSDIRIGPSPWVGPHRLATGECDLYLGCDVLVAAEPKNLAAASPQRTRAVVSTTRVPTGRQIADPSIAYPPLDDIRGLVTGRCLPRGNVWMDAAVLSRRYLGSDVHANVVLLGAAYQTGTIPLTAEAIEAAIRLNGVAIDANLAGFRLGRQYVADPGSVASRPPPAARPGPRGALLGLIGADPGSDLETAVTARVADLVGYQDEAYAKRYAIRVGAARAAELSACGLRDGPFARNVAIQLHRLMAYKDEYEVARLHLDPEVRRLVDSTFGTGSRITFHLRPEWLEAVGMKRKFAIGSAAQPAFRALHGLRRLRTSRFDPFKHTATRKLERDLLHEYERLIDAQVDRLTPASHRRAVELAGLPEMVRGFGPVKAEAVRRYRDRLHACAASR